MSGFKQKYYRVFSVRYCDANENYELNNISDGYQNSHAMFDSQEQAEKFIQSLPKNSGQFTIMPVYED